MKPEDKELMELLEKFISDLQSGLILMKKDNFSQAVMLIDLLLSGKEYKAIKKNIKGNWN